MATPTIDSEQFVLMQLPEGVPPYRETIEIIRRPGSDGDWSRALGKKGEPFEIITVARVADEAAAKTKIHTTYAGLLTGATGDLVTVTDAAGAAHSNVMLEDVVMVEHPRDSQTIVSAVAQSGSVTVRAKWSARLAGAP